MKTNLSGAALTSTLGAGETRQISLINAQNGGVPSLISYPARPIQGGKLDRAPKKIGLWYAEPKYNGWRAVVHCPSGTMWNRRAFTMETNRDWTNHTRPILEAFFHAKTFFALAVQYTKSLDHAPQMMPGGWAAVLYLSTTFAKLSARHSLGRNLRISEKVASHH